MDEPSKILWNALYEIDGFALHATIYAWAADLTPSGRVLDLGCEYGLGSLLVTETNPGLQVLSVDLDLSVLLSSCGIAGMEKISRANADAVHLPVANGTFNGIYLLNLLHMVEKPASVLSEVKRALKPEGLAVIGITNEAFQVSRQSKYELTRQLEGAINEQFSDVTYPKEIRGQIPSFPSRVFPLCHQNFAWIALCRKKLVEE